MNTKDTILSSLLCIFAIIIAVLFTCLLHEKSLSKNKESQCMEELSLYPPILHDSFGNTYTKEPSYSPYSITVPIDTTYDSKNHLMGISFIGEKDGIVTEYKYIYAYIKGRQGELVAHNITIYNGKLSQDMLGDMESKYTHLGILSPSRRTTLKAIEAPKVHFSSSLGDDPKQIVNNFRKQQKQIP